MLKLHSGNKDSMESRQVTRDCMEEEKMVDGDEKVLRRFTMRQK